MFIEVMNYFSLKVKLEEKLSAQPKFWVDLRMLFGFLARASIILQFIWEESGRVATALMI